MVWQKQVLMKPVTVITAGEDNISVKDVYEDDGILGRHVNVYEENDPKARSAKEYLANGDVKGVITDTDVKTDGSGAGGGWELGDVQPKREKSFLEKLSHSVGPIKDTIVDTIGPNAYNKSSDDIKVSLLGKAIATQGLNPELADVLRPDADIAKVIMGDASAGELANKLMGSTLGGAGTDPTSPFSITINGVTSLVNADPKDMGSLSEILGNVAGQAAVGGYTNIASVVGVLSTAAMLADKYDIPGLIDSVLDTIDCVEAKVESLRNMLINAAANGDLHAAEKYLNKLEIITTGTDIVGISDNYIDSIADEVVMAMVKNFRIRRTDVRSYGDIGNHLNDFLRDLDKNWVYVEGHTVHLAIIANASRDAAKVFKHVPHLAVYAAVSEHVDVEHIDRTIRRTFPQLLDW